GKGYVPAVTLPDGSVLTECPVILQYIADQKPEAGLAPKPGSAERYKLQEMLNFTTSELHKGMGTYFNPALNDGWRQAATDRLSLRLAPRGGDAPRAQKPQWPTTFPIATP